MSGLYPNLPHGASLLVTAEAYYKLVIPKLPKEFHKLSIAMGENPTYENGDLFLDGLRKLMNSTAIKSISMVDFGIHRQDIPKIADIAFRIGFEFDPYEVTRDEVESILESSF